MIAANLCKDYLDSFVANGAGAIIDDAWVPKINGLLARNCYIGVSTTTPSVQSDGSISNFTEPTDTQYGRVVIGHVDNNTGPNPYATKMAKAQVDQLDPSKSTTESPYVTFVNNNEFIFFPEPSPLGTGFGTLTHFGLFASATGGSPLIVGELVDPENPSTAKPVTVNKGQVLLFRKADATKTDYNKWGSFILYME